MSSEARARTQEGAVGQRCGKRGFFSFLRRVTPYLRGDAHPPLLLPIRLMGTVRVLVLTSWTREVLIPRVLHRVSGVQV